MDKYESVLTFFGYIVNEVTFVRNKNFKNVKEGMKVDIKIIPKIEQKDEKLEVNLVANIFEDAEEKNFPFYLKVDLTGHFEANGDKPSKYIPNAIAILYPYIRAIVSTYTTAANINPLILPTINVNKLIEDKKIKDK